MWRICELIQSCQHFTVSAAGYVGVIARLPLSLVESHRQVRATVFRATKTKDDSLKTRGINFKSLHTWAQYANGML